MEVTEVRLSLTPQEQAGHQRALAEIVLDNCFAIHGLRVMEGQKGCFVAMPARKGSDGEYRDVCHPITAEASQQIRGAVLTEYERAISRSFDEPDLAPQQPKRRHAAGVGTPRPRRTIDREAEGPER